MQANIKELALDIATVSNAITGLRYLLTPKMVRAFEKNPGKMWPVVALVMASDNVDGALARLGDKSEHMRAYGFRTSRFGRVFDPITDKRTTYKVGKACVDDGIIPKGIGRYAANQKATAAVRAGLSWARGLDVPVTKEGKHSEFAANAGFGVAVASESITNPLVRNSVRYLGLVAGTTAIGAAATADQGYGQTARQMAQTGEYTHESFSRIAVLGGLAATAAVVSITRADRLTLAQ